MIQKTKAFSYDAIYQVTQAATNGSTTDSYTYDDVGNRLTDWFGGTYSYNNSNELMSYPGYSWNYNNNGNTASKTVSGSTTSYNWDFENRLTSVALPGTGGTVTFKYDPFGRRIYKSSSSGTTIYAYDGDNMVEQLNSSGTATARYTQGLGIDEPLEVYEGAKSYYYHADGLGSVVALTKSTGTAANTYFGYNTFGGMPAPSETVANPFRFTGREWDSEISLYYYRARYYDSLFGRFLSEDPLGFLVDANFYAYTHNRPVTYVDPLGLQDFQEALNDILKVGLPNARAASRFAGEALAGAEEWASQRNLPDTSLHNGGADAWRHCFWSCTMTKYLGAYVAEIIADEHEEAGKRGRHRQPVPEEIMDRTNNRLGRTAALSDCSKDGKSCWDLCTDLYNHHRLAGIGGRPGYFPDDEKK